MLHLIVLVVLEGDFLKEDSFYYFAFSKNLFMHDLFARANIKSVKFCISRLLLASQFVLVQNRCIVPCGSKVKLIGLLFGGLQ